MAATDLRDVLEEFSTAFAAQSRTRLLQVFDDEEVSFLASEDLVVEGRASFESFVDAYTAQPVSFSFEWDSHQYHRDGEVGWIVALGREIRHAEQSTPAPFRMTLVCRLRSSRWRVVHLHASTPTGDV